MDRITYNTYRGITHSCPMFLLKPWKYFMCKRNVHVFAEVLSWDEHYLYCDACGLIVNIKSIDERWMK